ncbi:MAG: helix-turn-helix transcriptional regulator [Arhodomonas sp.]|nr:helix-turn-helix transcriptional regulator [Arhodomonas sp.]
MAHHPPVGQRVRHQRQHLGLTQAALARSVGISPSYLNLIEHNRRRIGGSLLRRLADVLEVDLHSLSGAEEARTEADLVEALADPVFAETSLGTRRRRPHSRRAGARPGGAYPVPGLSRRQRAAAAPLRADELGPLPGTAQPPDPHADHLHSLDLRDPARLWRSQRRAAPAVQYRPRGGE